MTAPYLHPGIRCRGQPVPPATPQWFRWLV